MGSENWSGVNWKKKQTHKVSVYDGDKFRNSVPEF